MLVKKTASCLQMLEWFEANHQIVEFPLPGDIVFFKYKTNNRRTNHVGLIVSVNSENDFGTEEGNTSLNSDDNGGAVMLRKRTKQNVVAFARPKYKNVNQIHRLLAIADGELGMKEYPPNSNNVKYNTWFYGRQVNGKNYPWCAVFISYIFYLLENGDEKPVRPTLRMGDKNPSVKLLQEVLSLKGYVIVPDGEFGPLTQGMVKNFQQVHGLTVDGVVGPKTWAKLFDE